MLRRDLTAAGIAYETPSGVCDFHSLRGAYISNLVASGASVKTCQTLARHSTPSLTIGVYAKASLHDISDAVESLPDLSPPDTRPEAATLAATGTDGRIRTQQRVAHGKRAGDGTGRDVADAGGNGDVSTPESVCRNPLELSGFDASGRTEAGVGRAGIEPATPGFSVSQTFMRQRPDSRSAI
jgi:hypothetical protein